MDEFPNWADHITVFVFSIVIPLSMIKQSMKDNSDVVYSSDQKRKIYFSICLSLFIMAAIIITVWLLFNRPLTELGLTPFISTTKPWIWAVVAFVLLYALDTFISLSNKKKIAASIKDWKKRTPFMPTKKEELPGYLLLCVCAGVFEEVVYRGYLVTYWRYLFEGSAFQLILSVLLPAFVFAISHFYQGTKSTIKVFILSSFFGYIFIQSGSLVIVMLLHFLVNVFGGLIGMKYMKEDKLKNVVGE